jgi:hypothetical protein
MRTSYSCISSPRLEKLLEVLTLVVSSWYSSSGVGVVFIGKYIYISVNLIGGGKVVLKSYRNFENNHKITTAPTIAEIISPIQL